MWAGRLEPQGCDNDDGDGEKEKNNTDDDGNEQGADDGPNDEMKTRTANAQKIHIRHEGCLHSHLPYIINHHEHLSCFMQPFNRMTAQVPALL